MTRKAIIGIGGILGGILFLYVYMYMPPSAFKTNTPFSVRKGDTLRDVSMRLKDEGYISSRMLFEVMVISFERERALVAGEYTFTTPLTVRSIAEKITKGVFGMVQNKITIPEGFTKEEIATVASVALPNFNKERFLERTKNDEGILFPDTYFFHKTATEEDVIKIMKQTFEKKTASLFATIPEGRTKEDIIIMASIVEKEAQGDKDREEVAAILWRRIREGKLLQVDAPFMYILGKKSEDLTLTDLKNTSLYNTYVHKGLPPTAIGNPGILALKAALTEKDSEYLFYLHDKSGTIHYAKNFDEHKRNIKVYLD